MPFSHRGEPIAANRTDARRLMKEAIDSIRTFTGLGAVAGPSYGQPRKRKNLPPFN